MVPEGEIVLEGLITRLSRKQCMMYRCTKKVLVHQSCRVKVLAKI